MQEVDPSRATTRFWIVWSPDGPAPPRATYRTIEGARQEAKRLAITKGPSRFYVLETVDAFEPVKVRRVDLIGAEQEDEDDIPF